MAVIDIRKDPAWETSVAMGAGGQGEMGQAFMELDRERRAGLNRIEINKYSKERTDEFGNIQQDQEQDQDLLQKELDYWLEEYFRALRAKEEAEYMRMMSGFGY